MSFQTRNSRTEIGDFFILYSAKLKWKIMHDRFIANGSIWHYCFSTSRRMIEEQSGSSPDRARLESMDLKEASRSIGFHE